MKKMADSQREDERQDGAGDLPDQGQRTAASQEPDLTVDARWPTANQTTYDSVLLYSRAVSPTPARTEKPETRHVCIGQNGTLPRIETSWLGSERATMTWADPLACVSWSS